MRSDSTVAAIAGAAVLAATALWPAAHPRADSRAPGGSGELRDAGSHQPPADHHMHVWTAEARDALVQLLTRGGEAEPPRVPTFDGDRVVARLDSAGIDRGVLLSTAYVFGAPELDVADERTMVLRETLPLADSVVDDLYDDRAPYLR